MRIYNFGLILFLMVCNLIMLPYWIFGYVPNRMYYYSVNKCDIYLCTFE